MPRLSKQNVETYSKIQDLIDDCNSYVPHLIGKLREKERISFDSEIIKGYTSDQLIGPKEHGDLNKQLDVNDAIF